MEEPIVQTPPNWKASGVPYCTGLTLDTAKKMLEAGEKLDVPMGQYITWSAKVGVNYHDHTRG